MAGITTRRGWFGPVTVVALAIVTLFSGGVAGGQTRHRIVSLGPSLTESLYLLGAQQTLVGTTTYCNRPEAARRKTRVGNLIDVNMEQVLVLQPTLVLVTPLTPPRVVDQLHQLGLTTRFMPMPTSYEALCDQFLELGRLVGKEAAARILVGQSRGAVQAIRDRPKSRQPRVFVQVGATPLFTMNKDSFVHEFITFSGGTNIAADARTGIYNKETVIQQNPDVILLVLMGQVGQKEKADWMVFTSMAAVRQNRLVFFDPDDIGSPTVVSFARTLDRVETVLQERTP